MARKHLNGQLNIFDLLNNWDGPAMGEEVEMVSLMPELEDEVEPEVMPQDNLELQIEPIVGKQENQAVRVEKAEQHETVKKTSLQKTINKTLEKSDKPVQEVQEASEEFIEDLAPDKKRKPTNFNEKVVMHRKFKQGGKDMDIAYLSYNKVRIRVTGEEDQVMEFASSKEAVDYYVDRIQELDDSGED